MNMTLLFPLSQEAKAMLRNDSHDAVWDDYPLIVTTLCSIAIVIREHLTDPEVNQILQGDIALRDALYRSLNTLHDVAQVLSSPIFSGTSPDRVIETIESSDVQRDISAVRDFHIHKTFLDMEGCDNQVVADRVTIISNLMTFRWRLATKSFYSYSFALVALMSANGLLPSILVRHAAPREYCHLFYHRVNASGLIMLAYAMKESIASGQTALQMQLNNVSRELSTFFDRDVIRFPNIRDAVEDAAAEFQDSSQQDPLLLLSKIYIPTLTRQDVLSMEATIGDIMRGIVAEDHIDNVGLQYSNGESIADYGRSTGQIEEGVTFIAFAGAHRWKAQFIEELFA
ncbi:hypothetical protein PV08_02796 [Exophiala spinifera]|uniref:Uncharacterized protein n=1 Tax=Exophiala spinifera TaxID=91928 RepID=A0A0D2BHX5_9EURO|nr:uncharacterized protein PV08_02796 [Exophiala spinifera]KIW18508.1 hypothetical protein PV08_02796 [Exophiala spinifera]